MEGILESVVAIVDDMSTDNPIKNKGEGQALILLPCDNGSILLIDILPDERGT